MERRRKRDNGACSSIVYVYIFQISVEMNFSPAAQRLRHQNGRDVIEELICKFRIDEYNVLSTSTVILENIR